MLENLKNSISKLSTVKLFFLISSLKDRVTIKPTVMFAKIQLCNHREKKIYFYISFVITSQCIILLYLHQMYAALESIKI